MRHTGRVRLLSSDLHDLDLTETVRDDDLVRLYTFPERGGIRTNFVATLDGAATGADGLTGSINNAADKVVFDLNRQLADVVVVGAATVDTEGYAPAAGKRPLIAVSNSALLPRGWSAGPQTPGMAVLVVPERADAAAVSRARDILGADNVWQMGADQVDLEELVARLRRDGLPRILSEGGPRLHTALLGLGLVDEVALTWVPTFAGGPAPRITADQQVTVDFRLRHLLESDGTLLGLWSRR